MLDLSQATSPDIERDCQGGNKIITLLPIGSVEPHGPHLPLGTDTSISLGACRVGSTLLEQQGYRVWLAPAVPYGVTEYARNFPGAVSIPSEVLTGYLVAVVRGLLKTGATTVVLVNNHLEPAHDAAIRAVTREFSPGQVGVACPLTRRWGRLLSPEFKHGSCHAGQYETSLILAIAPETVQTQVAATLPAVPISLAEKIQSGVTEFVEMGLDRAYAGSPAQATAQEGRDMLNILGQMVATEATELLKTLSGAG